MTTNHRTSKPRIARALALAICLAAAAVGQAAAQDTATQGQSREALLDAAREENAAKLEPPKRSRLERWLYRYDNSKVTPTIFGNWKGFGVGHSGFPAGAGIKFPVAYSHIFGSGYPDRPNVLEFDAIGAYSTRGYARVAAGFELRNVGGAPLDVRVRGDRYEYPQEDFFGFGPDSSLADRTNYLLRSTDVGADLVWRPTPVLEIGGGVSYLTPSVGSGTDKRYPSTETLFDPATVPGFQTQPDYLRADASVAIELRDNPLHPHFGGRYGVQFSNFADLDLDAFTFRQFEIDLQQYVPLPHRYRTLALHAAAVFSDPAHGQQVPLFLQPTLGGAQALRGFREFRFRDRNSLLLTAEYRWEAWWALDGAFFVDAGTVAFRPRDLALRDMDVSYGFGLRLHSNSAFIARLDLAFSREGFIPLLRFEHAF